MASITNGNGVVYIRSEIVAPFFRALALELAPTSARRYCAAALGLSTLESRNENRYPKQKDVHKQRTQTSCSVSRGASYAEHHPTRRIIPRTQVAYEYVCMPFGTADRGHCLLLREMNVQFGQRGRGPIGSAVSEQTGRTNLNLTMVDRTW